MLLEKAREFAPLFASQSSANEALGRLGDVTMDAVRRGKFLSLLVPKAFEGAEASPVEALQVIEALCQADGSTGWVVMAAGLSIAAASAFLEDEAAEELFGNGRFPLIAGHGAPNGKAVAEGNGFRLSGQWRYGSGVRNAEYIHSGAIIYDDGKPRLTAAGHPEVRIFITRHDEAVFDDKWDVLGLRGTGSVDYTMSDVFVPESFTHPQSVRAPKRGGSLYTMGLLGFALIGHTGFALGLGRRALDEVARYAREHEGSPSSLRTSERFHTGYASAEAHLRAAHALVYETWRDIEASLDRGEGMSNRQITLARLSLRHVTDMAAEAATFAYREAGGTSLRDGPLQRCFRDIHAGTQHLHTSSLVFAECGRELAGLAQGEMWGRFGLSKGESQLR